VRANRALELYARVERGEITQAEAEAEIVTDQEQRRARRKMWATVYAVLIVIGVVVVEVYTWVKEALE
jgi:predicted nucleic acid-binding Zn ribbon protein